MRWLTLLGLLWACEPPVAAPPMHPPLPAPPAGAGVRLAGESASTPLVLRLVREFSDRNPGEALVVESPLGGQGALRALKDNALDAALLVVPAGEVVPHGVRLASTEVVLAAGRGTGLRDHWTVPGLIAALGAPGGTRRFVLRGPEDPLEKALAQAAPPLALAFQEATEAQRWPVVADESAIRETLRGAPGAIVVSDTGALALHGLPVWPVRVVDPAPRVDLVLVTGADPPDRLTAFIAWARGPDGQALVADLGYREQR